MFICCFIAALLLPKHDELLLLSVCLSLGYASFVMVVEICSFLQYSAVDAYASINTSVGTPHAWSSLEISYFVDSLMCKWVDGKRTGRSSFDSRPNFPTREHT